MITFNEGDKDKPFLLQFGTATLRVSVAGLARVAAESRQALDEHYVRTLGAIITQLPKPKPPRKPPAPRKAKAPKVWEKEGYCVICHIWHDHRPNCEFVDVKWGA